MFYAGINSSKPHFSDKDVLLLNTLDYPSYSYGTELIKCAYKTLYSIFDKTAFLINSYFRLGVEEHRVSFRSIWYKDKEIRQLFDNSKKLPYPLKIKGFGLFYLCPTTSG